MTTSLSRCFGTSRARRYNRSGEVELPEFIQIMTMTREAEQEAQFWGDKSPRHARGDEAVPLHYLTAAYRRKRVMDNVMDAELRLTYTQPKQIGEARYSDV